MVKKPFVELRRCRSEDGVVISCRACYEEDYDIYLSCLEESEKEWRGIKCDPRKLQPQTFEKEPPR